MNATKHVVSSPVTFSDAGSTPAASTILLPISSSFPATARFGASPRRTRSQLG